MITSRDIIQANNFFGLMKSIPNIKLIYISHGSVHTTWISEVNC